MVSGATEIFDDLTDEFDRLEEILDGLDQSQWLAPSAADGWSVADVVLHLAQTEEMVVNTTQGADLLASLPPSNATTMDGLMADLVAAEDSAPEQTFERWKLARRASVAALRAADPGTPIPWAAAPLKPTALATTRLAEHWAHGLDITDGLSIPFPDTDRLRHIAWLAHRSLPYGYALAGEEPHDVYAELTSPDGSTIWRYGDPGTDSTITGSVGAFCRVGAQRLSPDESGLVTGGPHGAAALQVLRNYAG